MILTAYSDLSMDDLCAMVNNSDELTDLETELFNRVNLLLALLEDLGIEIKYSLRGDSQAAN